MSAAATLHQLICELDIDIIFIQEPYITRAGKVADTPIGYSSFHRLGPDHQYGSVVMYKSNLHCKGLVEHTRNELCHRSYLKLNGSILTILCNVL